MINSNFLIDQFQDRIFDKSPTALKETLFSAVYYGIFQLKGFIFEYITDSHLT